MLKTLFFMLLVRPLILFVTGVHVQGRELLPEKGPCIIAANHNSHLDTLVLMSLFPLSMLGSVRPVAAADYFLKNRLVAWFSRKVIGIIPLRRRPDRSEGHPFSGVHKALEEGAVVIIFPEGSRGEPETIAPFKTGIAHLAKAFPGVPVLPVYVHGAGKSLPKGEALFVPFVIDVTVAPPLHAGEETPRAFTERLEAGIRALREAHTNKRSNL
jgi:1-acyl-sn-glycerol-3-phosphate acyltransferase